MPRYRKCLFIRIESGDITADTLEAARDQLDAPRRERQNQYRHPIYQRFNLTTQRWETIHDAADEDEEELEDSEERTEAERDDCAKQQFMSNGGDWAICRECSVVCAPRHTELCAGCSGYD